MKDRITAVIVATIIILAGAVMYDLGYRHGAADARQHNGGMK